MDTDTNLNTDQVERKVIRGKVRAAYDAYVAAKQQEAEAKKAKAEAAAILREFLGEATEAYIGKVLALKVVPSKNTGFDRKVLHEVYPEAYKASYRETLYTKLEVTS
jgi:hypothetical protein